MEESVAPSSTTAQPESAENQPPSTSSPPRVKREHEETDDGSTPPEVPTKKRRKKANNNHNVPSRELKKGPMASLHRGLEWIEQNDDLTDEVKEVAKQLRALVFNPIANDFRGYKNEENQAKLQDDISMIEADIKKEATNHLKSQFDIEKAQLDKEAEVKSNPHTNVPPPFALPDKSNFMKGPTPALDKLNKDAPSLMKLPPVPASKNYNTTNLVAAPANSVLPAAPQITNVAYAQAPFVHTSLLPAYVAPTGTNSYEPLEFLGDAYLEVIATRLIHSRFPNHTVGQKAGLRELLVKNETLAEYSKAYGFGERVQSNHKERHGPVWTKVLGDVFEAYLAAVIIQDEDSDAGFLVAERWLTELWAPKILEWRKRGDGLNDTSKSNDQTMDPKTDLNKLLSGKDARIEYREEKPMELIREGNRTVFFMGVYLHGWGFQNQHLGSGEGRSKSLATVAAAEYALSNSQDIIQTAHARKVQFERQYKKNNGGRGGQGGYGGGRSGGYRGGRGGAFRGGGGVGVGGFPGLQGQAPYAGGPPMYPTPQHQMQHPLPPHQPPQSMSFGHGQHPTPGSWAPPGPH